MPEDYEQKRIWFKKGDRFTRVVDKSPDGEESNLHLDKFKTRLCIDCTETIYDTDGTIKENYVLEERGFLKVKSTGRPPEYCDECGKRKDRDRKREEREQLKQKDQSDCTYLAGCLKEYVPSEYETLQDMQMNLCFDCEGDERPENY